LYKPRLGAFRSWTRRPRSNPRWPCSDTSAVIYAAPEHRSDTMDAVARFALAARQTAAPEARMAATWPQIKAHTPLAHAVTRQQQRLQPQVNALTEQATEMRPCICVCRRRSIRLCPAVKSEEDPIQFALDHYELAIDPDRGGAPGAAARVPIYPF
jgi:hypothetical protein